MATPPRSIALADVKKKAPELKRVVKAWCDQRDTAT
jgi:hypothetical protein